jgi:transcriptional regulator
MNAMYLPSHFEEARQDVLHDFMRTHPFALLVTQGEPGLDANAVPFLLDAHRGPLGTLRAHVARANPVWQDARRDADSLVVFQGPQAYVSPAWYATKAQTGKVVPTWNYLMVEARGRLRIHDDADWVRQLVGELTTVHEAARDTPWSVTDAPAHYIDTMLRAIVGIELELTSLRGKWKASQNRSAADRDGVAKGLSAVNRDDAQDMSRQVRYPGMPGDR